MVAPVVEMASRHLHSLVDVLIILWMEEIRHQLISGLSHYGVSTLLVLQDLLFPQYSCNSTINDGCQDSLQINSAIMNHTWQIGSVSDYDLGAVVITRNNIIIR